jgi:hypothetical protein
VTLLKAESVLDAVDPDQELTYIIRLNNGDLVTGKVIELIEDAKYGKGIRFQTELGKAVIYESQISSLIPKDEYYKHSHRIFLQPTAEPISSDHFVGLYELFFLYGGVGITDYVSITAGRSFLPYIPSQDQISEINGKISIFTMDFEDVQGKMSLAFGANLAFINHNNRFIHYFGVVSFTGQKSLINLTLFYKAGSEDSYIIKIDEWEEQLIYENGSMGIGLGLDTRISKRHDLRFIGELWNVNIAKPTNTAILLGLRLNNAMFSADFGLAFSTQPFMAPFASFTITPF